MAVNTNNPPGRLHDIFRRAREAGDASPAYIWSRAFGLNEKDVLVLIKRLLDVLLVVDETEKGFKKFPELEGAKFVEPIAPIRSVLANSLANLRQSHTGLVSPVSDRYMTLLEFEVVGPAALEKGLIEVLGQSRWAWTHMDKPTENSPGGKLLKKLGAIVVSLSAAMTFANTAHKTIETWGPDILMLTSAPEIPPVPLPELEGSKPFDKQGNNLDS